MTDEDALNPYNNFEKAMFGTRNARNDFAMF